MFDRLEISFAPVSFESHRLVRLRVNGEDVVDDGAGPGARGLGVDRMFPLDAPSPLRATSEPRRVDLGEPDCTGGCCGFLSAVVRRHGDVVQWTEWLVPDGESRPPELDFEADAYDAELTRAEAELGAAEAAHAEREALTPGAARTEAEAYIARAVEAAGERFGPETARTVARLLTEQLEGSTGPGRRRRAGGPEGAGYRREPGGPTGAEPRRTEPEGPSGPARGTGADGATDGPKGG
ncbi:MULTISPECIES: hypothetical protein [unclassified Streptomyces]|uniref:hypothetical protein n=1 Tax=unclassified Streptomyces TaxID=2593676 RepID=UPI0019D26D1C|nr:MULTISPECIES: hypothetical protein [unclassified Streptomyces]